VTHHRAQTANPPNGSRIGQSPATADRFAAEPGIDLIGNRIHLFLLLVEGVLFDSLNFFVTLYNRRSKKEGAHFFSFFRKGYPPRTKNSFGSHVRQSASQKPRSPHPQPEGQNEVSP